MIYLTVVVRQVKNSQEEAPVTMAMITAGVATLENYRGASDDYEIVKRIYDAMECAKIAQKLRPPAKPTE